MDEHHPAVLDTLWCCDVDSAEEARRVGAKRARYAVEWGAYLEEQDCTWDEDC
jgi:hypothetical protein